MEAFFFLIRNSTAIALGSNFFSSGTCCLSNSVSRTGHTSTAREAITGETRCLYAIRLSGSLSIDTDLKRFDIHRGQIDLGGILIFSRDGTPRSHRTVYPEVPPKVEYKLTEIGLDLRPALQALVRWSETRRKASRDDG